MKLRTYYKNKLYEAGCDEAGRGPLAGPVFAAAVILNHKQPIRGLNDSKLLCEEDRNLLRKEIEKKAIGWAVYKMDAPQIDEYNILQASLRSMRECIKQLTITPVLVLVDGNQKIPDLEIEQYCMVQGDGRFKSIAAASILAKTHRDEYMAQIHEEYPHYGWIENKGYPTIRHRQAIQEYGLCPYHRKTFNVKLPHVTNIPIEYD